MITVLVTARELEAGSVEITGEAYRHLFRARRLAVGAELRLVDGVGHARRGRVESVGPRSARVVAGDAAEARDPVRQVVLLVAPPRPSRASWLVEKATELGVAAIRWLAAERTPRDLGDGGLERLHRVAAAALEQCGGATLPELSGPHELDEAAALSAACPRRVYLAPGAASDVAGPWPGSAALALAVGPEGGWTEAETALLEAAGFVPRGLGERILRVETAALAGATLALFVASR